MGTKFRLMTHAEPPLIGILKFPSLDCVPPSSSLCPLAFPTPPPFTQGPGPTGMGSVRPSGPVVWEKAPGSSHSIIKYL